MGGKREHNKTKQKSQTLISKWKFNQSPNDDPSKGSLGYCEISKGYIEIDKWYKQYKISEFFLVYLVIQD